MTRFTRTEKDSQMLKTKKVRGCDDKFPGDFPYTFRSRQASCPSILPTTVNALTTWDELSPRTSKAELNRGCAAPIRRHSWSNGAAAHTEFLHKYNGALMQRKLSTDSRKSSIASVPEPIEECSSDDELCESPFEEYDYMHCINCSRSGSTTSLESSASDNCSSHQNINYCYKCKHLLKSKPFVQAFSEGRRGSLTDCFSNSPRRSRRSSLTDSIDLPMISEPSIDDETNDTAELQLLVEKEVNRLKNFSWAKK